VVENQANQIHIAIANLARGLHNSSLAGSDVDAVLESITAGAVEHVGGTMYAGILLVEKRKKKTQSVATTDPIVEKLDAIQMDVGEGPCLEAAWEHDTFRLNDFTTETRFPRFIAEALTQTAVKSSLSFELYSNESSMGALNLFSEEKDAFPLAAEETGLVYATHAALALYRAREKEHFTSALASRDVIGQAKGMIMERFNIDSLQAFELLRKLSQDSNTPIADIARQLVETDHPSRAG
jgi:transcriptional regulator with GAF, ATPase, and Fis domain